MESFIYSTGNSSLKYFIHFMSTKQLILFFKIFKINFMEVIFYLFASVKLKRVVFYINDYGQNFTWWIILYTFAFCRKKYDISSGKCIKFVKWVFYDNFNNVLSQNSLVKNIKQKPMWKIYGHLFSLQKEMLRSESFIKHIFLYIEIRKISKM